MVVQNQFHLVLPGFVRHLPIFGGGPKSVTNSSNYHVGSNRLRSLKGAPEEVNMFTVSYNNLTSLEHCPRIVKGVMLCDNNPIDTLDYFPDYVRVVGNLHAMQAIHHVSAFTGA
jgi:hypothetical protein